MKVTYRRDDGVDVNEVLKYTYMAENGVFWIQEFVNGDQYRLYEMTSVQNRPYFLRVTMY